jgi:hypothetical protein
MKDYLNEINNLYPVRKKYQDKTRFIEYVKQEVTEYKIEVQEKRKTRNIVIGDVENARVVFTAHYDTPAAALIPNIMMPVNKIIYFGYTFAFVGIIVAVSIFLAEVLTWLLNANERQFTSVAYLGIYFLLVYLTMLAFENKNNKNDNTSGVAAVMSLIKNIDKDSNVAFILFDNEEKGLIGSGQFNKQNKKMMENKPLINLDCIGNGNEIVVIFNNEKMESVDLLKESVVGNERYNVNFFNKNGVGVFACHKGKYIKLYTPYIHTAKDTVADVENINYLTETLTEYVSKLNEV